MAVRHSASLCRPDRPLAAAQSATDNIDNNLKVVDEMKPCQSVEEAVSAIRQFNGSPEEFTLAIAKTLLDPVGVNMAIVTDAILKKGWMPDGFVDNDDHRLYRYKAVE
jgi:hypothetical protein